MRTAESPFTGNSANEIWGWKDGKPVFKCPDTGAIFFDRESVKTEDYADYYPYLDGFDSSRFSWELAIRRKRYQKQLAIMAALSPGKRLLDVGAGPGYLCRVASDEGWTAFGCEISDDARKHGIKEFDVSYRLLEDVPQASIDVVTCHHILEHIRKPMSFLQTLGECLVRDGLMVIHVPHQEPFSAKLKNMLRPSADETKEISCALYDDEHISGFTQRSLRTVLALAGFETLSIRTVGMGSKFYDPFFWKNYFRSGEMRGMFWNLTRQTLNNVGVLFGMGDWVVGYFRKTNGSGSRND